MCLQKLCGSDAEKINCMDASVGKSLVCLPNIIMGAAPGDDMQSLSPAGTGPGSFIQMSAPSSYFLLVVVYGVGAALEKPLTAATWRKPCLIVAHR